ncbi:MAG: hypothetical protein M2R45_04053 [Verrucomicrobia subdivision 3 bacterium]|nr:hypothetical protein [Limisphaerales bacterium]MCS1416963.1 hypothetical protein [Limisphaerales bacterium]
MASYVREFAGRLNLGFDSTTCLDTLLQGMLGKRLTWKQLTQATLQLYPNRHDPEKRDQPALWQVQ